MRVIVLLCLAISLLFAEDTSDSSTAKHLVESNREIDLTNWEHPTKRVFQSNGIEIKRVVLKDETFPLFYVASLQRILSTMPTQVREKALEDLFIANGYWDYTLIDNVKGDKLEVFGDRQKKTILRFSVNGDDSYFERSETAETKNELSLFDLLVARDSSVVTSDIKLFTDLNSDENPEAIVAKSGVYKLYTSDGSLKYVGDLDPNLSVIYDIDSATTLKLNKRDNNLHVQLHLSHMSGASGYALFRYDGKKITHVETNYPTSTASGRRYLADVDGDGTLDAVTQIEIRGGQHRIVEMYQAVGSTDDTYQSYATYGPEGFKHPDSAKALIISFIEAVSLTQKFNCDFEKEIKALSTSNMKYDVSQNPYAALNPASLAEYPLDLSLSVNFQNREETLYTFKISGDESNRSYYCNVVKEGENLKVDSIE